MILDSALLDPSREFSLLPFWFWNDDLSENDLLRQMDDMEAHGVYGFVIHPRVGLPRSIGWMSERMLYFVRFVVDEAARRGMQVVLYDEGMYPSGSSSGQVVQEDPLYQCRCLAPMNLAGDELPALSSGWNLVAVVERVNGQKMAIVDRPVNAFIRGLHYIGEGPQEDEPPAADILNPDAVSTFIHLVYDRYFAVLGDHFGRTVIAMFTDEPGLLGRCREKNVWPGTTDILQHVNAFLGYDFTPYLPALWYDDESDAARHRAAYARALVHRLEETFYGPLSAWCAEHGIALAGHPSAGDEIGLLRHFHIPGQDIVWRWVLPGRTAVQGRESTQGKCSSSAMQHLGRRRNSNECFGAYGHQFTWDEMKWIVHWCFVRGVNLLYPHAFYYSIRGPRRDERPPDVGPHAPWWNDYKPFADGCRRVCWLNTDSQHVCDIAILGQADYLPWSAAQVCLEHQRDFNYLEIRHLWENAHTDMTGIHIANMHYRALIVEDIGDMPPLAGPALDMLRQAGRLIDWSGDASSLLAALDRLTCPNIQVSPPQPDLRCRHVIKNRVHYYLLSNEGLCPISFRLEGLPDGEAMWFDPYPASLEPLPVEMKLLPYTMGVLMICVDQR